ncbi:MAG TPA: PQQ-dependent sugar dehydrogenase [Actinomycetota bacterium]|nr:PQQ-dependent sugar dehydrogenase [Actinomycetota bacterium]
MNHKRQLRRFLPATVIAAGLVALTPGAAASLPSGTGVQVYKSGLHFPVDMAWVHGTNKLFFTEKNSGKIRVLAGRALLARPCATLPVNAAGERGLLGIALDPRFKTNYRLYVYYTNASPLENRVRRFVVRDNLCIQGRNIITGILASSTGYHNGGQLEFVNGKLFVSTGEAHEASAAQDTSNRLGKVLRYNPDGTVPAGNPFGRYNPVWSYGHRNPFGLAHKPGTSKLYETENGPQCDDEVNLIARGGNYGWGAAYRCGTAGVGANPRPPLMRWTPPIVPTDAAWYNGGLTAMTGSLYFGDFQTGRLHRLDLSASGDRITRHRIALDASAGIVDVSMGPGGWLYFSTPKAIFRIARR